METLTAPTKLSPHPSAVYPPSPNFQGLSQRKEYYSEYPEYPEYPESKIILIQGVTGDPDCSYQIVTIPTSGLASSQGVQ